MNGMNLIKKKHEYAGLIYESITAPSVFERPWLYFIIFYSGSHTEISTVTYYIERLKSIAVDTRSCTLTHSALLFFVMSLTRFSYGAHPNPGRREPTSSKYVPAVGTALYKTYCLKFLLFLCAEILKYFLSFMILRI